MLKECYVKKIIAVSKLSDAVTYGQPNIESLEYEVYVDENEIVQEEYLVVNYVGGAKSVRNCYGNSFSANFNEVNKLLDHGNYDIEVKNQYEFIASKYRKASIFDK